MSEHSSVLTRYPAYEAVIGVEVHVQLVTKSKIFCSCNNGPCERSNAHIDPVCTGHPGVLPVLNKQVVEYAVMAGLATKCEIASTSTFARKHYVYPDLPKGYQITQGDQPICQNGEITIKDAQGKDKNIRIMRIHMEEDAGKNTHVADSSVSFVDYNRAGTPLLEIVSHPDLSSSHEVRAYLKELHAIVTTLGICTGNMEDGAFRADTNISVRKKGETHLNTKCELKNINSFKFIADAVEYEIERQIQMMEAGKKVVQQTRLWDTKNKSTFVMREKEGAADYRYFLDPDLPRLELHQEFIETISKKLPELPSQRRVRMGEVYGLSEYEVSVLTDDPLYADYFEKTYQKASSPHVIKWVLREVARFCKDSKQSPDQLLFTPECLAELVRMLDSNTLTARLAQQVFEACVATGQNPRAYVEAHGLHVKGFSEEELKALIVKLMEENAQAVQDYRAGKEKLFGFFVGRAMALTKGAADPGQINEMLKKMLAGS